MKKIKVLIFGVFVVIIIFVTLLVSGRFPKIYTRNKETKMSQDLGEKLNNNFNKMMAYATFNNTNVTGTQVISAGNLFFKDGVSISVKTLGDTEYKKYTQDKPYIVKDAKGLSKINDNGKFTSTLVKDKNGPVTEIRFEEIK